MSEAERHDLPPIAGTPVTLASGLRRILAPNPSPMTYHGTNTYLVGETQLAVIDPGPVVPGHLEAILAAVPGGAAITAILVTHSHRDHSPLARPLADATGAPVYGFGPSAAGRSAIMEDLAASGLAGGGEGVDPDFAPDQPLRDGARLRLGDDEIEAIWTPGHMGNHLSFAWRDALFCGDLIMGWASTMVSPPDGDLAAFYDSCTRLRARAETRFYPGHGAPIHEPRERIDWLMQHRQDRDSQIRAALVGRPADLHTLTHRVYSDVDPALLPAASRNVLAHLIELHGRRKIRATPELSDKALFSLES